MGLHQSFCQFNRVELFISTLQTFDSSNLLSDNAAEGFESFQDNIPVVAYTTSANEDAAQIRCS